MTTVNTPEGPITCLFTDMENSTSLSRDVPPDAWKRTAGEHDAILTQCITAHGGHPERTEGDSFFATFASTLAALRCAATIQERLHADGKPRLTVEKQGETLPIKVRIGVHCVTQEVYRTQQGAYRDYQIALAQRIMDCGVGEQIVVSAEAWTAGQAYIAQEWRAWENRIVRDLPGPATLYELLWDGATHRKIRAPLWIPDWLRRAEDTFIGRDTYLADIVQRLQSGPRLVLLHGDGGIGKTRLALETAKHMDEFFKGRIFGVSLDTGVTGDPEQVTDKQVLGLIALAVYAPQNIRDAEDAGVLATHLLRRYPEEPFLLILDNFESANNDATRVLLGTLLRALPGLRCLVTCRTDFDVAPYTAPVAIGMLKIPKTAADDLEQFEGYRLFCDRARQKQPPPVLTDTAALVRILQATGGSALGIELVAARAGLPLTPLSKIAADLNRSLLDTQSTARGNSRADAPRHLNMEACIQWSYQLLPPEERQLYAHLSVFPADFTPQAAQGIADVTLDMLIGWIRCHLLSEVEGRCLLQPVLREFAQRRLPPEEQPTLDARFTAWYTALAAANADMNREAQRGALCAEIGNLHAAARQLTSGVLTSELANRLISLGIALSKIPLGVRSENLQQAIACYTAALRVYTEQAFPADWAGTQQNLAAVFWEQGEQEATVASMHMAIRGYRRVGLMQEAQTLVDFLRGIGANETEA